MKLMSRSLALLGAFALSAATPAAAAPIVSGQIVGLPTLGWAAANDVKLVNLGSGLPGRQNAIGSPILAGGASIMFNPNSGVYSGNVSGITRSPIRTSIAQATNLNYLNARAESGEITIDFGTRLLQEFSLIWGSLDPLPATYNVLMFFNGASPTGDVITGSNVNANVSGIVAGTTDVAVRIENLAPFTRVVATATQEAFEFSLANVGGADPFIISAPTALALLGAGLFGLGLVARRDGGLTAAA